MARILLVDDEPGVRFALSEVVRDRGHEPIVCASGAEALGKLAGVDAAVVDLTMPGMDGMTLLRAIHERDEALPVLLLTAYGSERIAVEAMKSGAYDYMTKPFDIDELSLVIERAVEAHRLRRANLQLRAERALGRRVIGDSPAMRKLLDETARVAARDVTVLLCGESGSGKEMIASLLHAQGRRSDKPFVRFNCAAIPSELADAELFGHARGAFTGAAGARAGFFTQANHGTLVLDEVGELPLGIQAKLLRALQDGEIQPVGSGRIERVDVRIVTSTHRDLAAEVKAGRFREDLYFRIAVVELRVPALRERVEDIPALAEEFARRYAEKFSMTNVELSAGLVERLTRSAWPGNVRQLENTVARMVALSAGGVIPPEAFAPVVEAVVASETPDAPHVTLTSVDDEAPRLDGGPSLREQVEAFERNLIARALEASHGNHSEAARRLGTSRATLVDKIRKYQIEHLGR